MDTLYTFLGNITHYKTESVNFFGGLMNSATKASLAAPKVRFVVQDSGLWGSEGSRCPRSRGLGFRD